MNFTREPIIETVITPREGCKLVVRSSKGNGQEDYFVDAVEVVSFGHSFFFRSQERPKSFLVPVSDYEILELKETRMVLKNASMDRSIKIGGGKEASARPKEEGQTAASLEPKPPSEKSGQEPRQNERKRDRRRRGRRGRDREILENAAAAIKPDKEEEEDLSPSSELGQQTHEAKPSQETEVEKAPSFISKLFPPPPTLIKETLTRYKSVDGEIIPPKDESAEENIFEHPTFEEKPMEDDNEE